MEETQSIAMDEDDRDDFLGVGGTGVISFAEAGAEFPHSIPVSYGYDAEETTFYFRLAVGADSEKGDVADGAVTFVTYGERDDSWRSVIVKGRLEETTEQSIATESLEGLQRVHIPLVDIFGRPIKEVPFEFYRLVPEEISSRKESSTEL
jgi:nitroimidazol reductase NimA-like FMN-containing flavoprotein (pyridoxamine 5'-phosphate oxidase superfamily)